MTKRAAVYHRVSTDGQTSDNQRLELGQVAKTAGWGIVEAYIDDDVLRSGGPNGALAREARRGAWITTISAPVISIFTPESVDHRIYAKCKIENRVRSILRSDLGRTSLLDTFASISILFLLSHAKGL